MYKLREMLKILLILSLLLISTEADTENKGESLAILDGEVITKDDIIRYTEGIEDKRYRELLKSKEGLKKLVNLYIDRILLIKYAKDILGEDENTYLSHLTEGEDNAYLIALLKREVFEKAVVTDREVKEYMKRHNLNEWHARYKLISEKRERYYRMLLNRVRQGHQIEILID